MRKPQDAAGEWLSGAQHLPPGCACSSLCNTVRTKHSFHCQPVCKPELFSRCAVCPLAGAPLTPPPHPACPTQELTEFYDRVMLQQQDDSAPPVDGEPLSPTQTTVGFGAAAALTPAKQGSVLARRNIAVVARAGGSALAEQPADLEAPAQQRLHGRSPGEVQAVTPARPQPASTPRRATAHEGERQLGCIAWHPGLSLPAYQLLRCIPALLHARCQQTRPGGRRSPLTSHVCFPVAAADSPGAAASPATVMRSSMSMALVSLRVSAKGRGERGSVGLCARHAGRGVVVDARLWATVGSSAAAGPMETRRFMKRLAFCLPC